ncbi:hypothetical protein ACWKWU_22300 [Chitinophaga lutea]
MKERIDTCVAGEGVICGLEVHVQPDCSIEVSEGTLVLPDGAVRHIAQQRFRRYRKPGQISQKVKKFMLEYLRLEKISERNMEFLQLADDTAPAGSTDSLKQQHPDDIPERNLNRDKVMVVLALPVSDSSDLKLYWVLVTRNAMAATAGMEQAPDEDDQALFSKILAPRDIDIADVDRFLRPVLQLPLLHMRRFGFQQLAIIQPAEGLQESNLEPPFTGVNSFAQIFYEYKAIIDEYVPVFRDALKTLHDHFGPVLTHKGADFLEQYRRMLTLKLNAFCEEGEHLYYIQYLYDWLRDLTVAYNELASRLSGFRGACTCKEVTKEEGEGISFPGFLVMLGPVLGGRSTYSPLIFRDLAQPADKDALIREIRQLHWRMMVMIRTFDLPFLHLDKALASSDQGVEERLDSTDHWESLGEQPSALPVKLTPSRGPSWPLGKRAIPYYYPLDSNSVYSLHRFWDYEATVLRRTDTHLSYNAYEGDSDKPSTDTVNDSYSNRPEVLLPLAFDLEPYHWLRPEGHIGRLVELNPDNNTFMLEGCNLAEYIDKYNICLDVIACPLPGSDGVNPLQFLQGLEHRPALQQGQTLVLLFAASNEQIELAECRKTERPEVAERTVVADFVLPYRFSCCPNYGVTYYPLHIARRNDV